MSAKKTSTSWFEPDAQAANSATSTTYYSSTPDVHYSSAQAAVQLTRSGLTWNGFQVYNKPVALSFAFLDNATASPRGDKGIVAFNSEQRAAALQSLQAWADVANIKFTQVSSGARLTFANYTQFADGKQANDQAYAYLPGTHKAAGSMWFNYNMANIRSPEHYEYGRQTLTHELGHALGLSHPGDYNSGNGVISYNASASYIEDSRQYSLMSYWSETNTGGNFYGHYAVAPLLHDIAAIQRLYGANMTTRTGNTVYGFGSNTGRDYYTAVHSNDALIFSIWDAGGNDTLNFSGYAQSQQINLNAQTFSDVGGLKGNVSIALGVVIENAIAGAGHDTLIGNAVANSLRGNGGNDRLYGNDGNDALYGDSGLDLLYGGNGNDALYGGDDSDTLYGDRGLDLLYGGESSDTLYGGNDSDTLYGENGSDRLFGGEGNDILYGGNSNDILYGENGNDRLYGGEGDDQLFGGNGNDIQYGENGNDRLYGGEGIDTLYGGNGNDQLFGENGNDRLEGGAGMDKLYGGGGMDKLYGGAHSDLFIFTSIKDSLPTLRDLIGDFTSGSDKIDLSALDSSAHPLHFTSKFTGKLGEMQMTWDVKAHLTHLSLNLTGDIHPDMTIDIAAHPDLRIDFIV